MGLLNGGNPGRGGNPGGPRGPCGPGPPFPLPLSFLNFDFILKYHNFSLSLNTHARTPSVIIIRMIKSHIHQLLPSGDVFVRQQIPCPSQE